MATGLREAWHSCGHDFTPGIQKLANRMEPSDFLLWNLTKDTARPMSLLCQIALSIIGKVLAIFTASLRLRASSLSHLLYQ
ncbi:hypothetical protein K474DRAFT_1667902 [Panus rudis PR-1116 ss-1]|nr:hypothetical protein K474DRAFT_1667902 [Panus rudis PR-1116 ss-1]